MNAIGSMTGSPKGRGKALLLSVAGAALLAALPMNSASAESFAPSALLLADMQPVSDMVLASNRGGFRVGHLDISVGFRVSTSVSGPHIHPFTVTTNFTVENPGQLQNTGTEIAQSVSQSGPSSHTSSTTTQDSAPATKFSLQLGPSSSDSPSVTGHQSSQNEVSQNVSPPVTATDTKTTPQQSSDVVANVVPSTAPPSSSSANDVAPPPPPPTTTVAATQPTTDPAPTPSTGSTPQSTPAPVVHTQTAQNTAPPPSTQAPAVQTQVAKKTDSTPPSVATPPVQTQVAKNTPPPTQQKQQNSVSGFVATVDPSTNSVVVTNNAGTDVVVNASHGILTTIKNNLSGLTFKSEVDLNYAINNYHDALTSAQAFMQATSIADQMLAVHGFGRQ